MQKNPNEIEIRDPVSRKLAFTLDPNTGEVVVRRRGEESRFKLDDLQRMARPPQRMAHGTTAFQGGLAVVGEPGPELITLPKGAEVRAAAHLQEMARRSEVVITTYHCLNADELLRRIREAVRQELDRMASGDEDAAAGVISR